MIFLTVCNYNRWKNSTELSLKKLGLKSDAKSIYIKKDSEALIFTNYYRFHQLPLREILFRIFRLKEVRYYLI